MGIMVTHAMSAGNPVFEATGVSGAGRKTAEVTGAEALTPPAVTSALFRLLSPT
jgi:hypothetical protein